MRIMVILIVWQTTIFNTGISEPRDYSEDEINRIEKTESNLPKTKEDGKRPNILVPSARVFL